MQQLGAITAGRAEARSEPERRPAPRASYLINVQILRFLAAGMVLFAHLLWEVQDHRIAGMPNLIDLTNIKWGSGVDVFFIVSGFIMAYLTRGNFGSFTYAAEFLKRRLVRVAPLYWIFTTLMLVAIWQASRYVHHGEVSAGRIAASYLFFPSARNDGAVQPVLGLGWTLEFEMFFYLAFSLALLASERVGLWALSVGFLGLVAIGHVAHFSWTPLTFWSNPIIIEFVVGLALGRLYCQGGAIGRRTQIALLCLSPFLLAVAGNYMTLDRWIWGGAPALVLAVALALGPVFDGPVGRTLARGGDASYALYLSHPFTLNLVAVGWMKLHLPLNHWMYIVTAGTACLAVAYGVHRLVEKPILHGLKGLYRPLPNGARA